MSPAAAEFARRGEQLLASHYRSKARTALARARQARWAGREQAVAGLVHDALWWRRFAQRFAARARQAGAR